jgi:tRNA(Arg) A34 adenosine deaminase TadA
MHVSSWRAALFAALATGAFNLAFAQAVRPFTTLNEALETDGRSVSLPASADGLMTVTPCAQCAMKSMRATSATTYFFREQPTTLAELKNAVAANPDVFLTVRYSLKSGELLSITASMDAPVTRNR